MAQRRYSSSGAGLLAGIRVIVIDLPGHGRSGGRFNSLLPMLTVVMSLFETYIPFRELLKLLLPLSQITIILALRD
jgi:pimeloyl-ACP methyl ester carboxylesterase